MLEFIGLTVFVLLALLVTSGFAVYPLVWLFYSPVHRAPELTGKAPRATRGRRSMHGDHGAHAPA